MAHHLVIVRLWLRLTMKPIASLFRNTTIHVIGRERIYDSFLVADVPSGQQFQKPYTSVFPATILNVSMYAVIAEMTTPILRIHYQWNIIARPIWVNHGDNPNSLMSTEEQHTYQQKKFTDVNERTSQMLTKEHQQCFEKRFIRDRYQVVIPYSWLYHIMLLLFFMINWSIMGYCAKNETCTTLTNFMSSTLLILVCFPSAGCFKTDYGFSIDSKPRHEHSRLAEL